MALTLAPPASLQDTDSSSVLSQVSQALSSAPASAQPAATKNSNKAYIDGFLDSPSSFFTGTSGQDKNSTTRRVSNRVYKRKNSNSLLRSSELGSSTSYSSPSSPPSRPRSATVTVSGTRPSPRPPSSAFICPPKSLLQESSCHLPDTTPVKTPSYPPRVSPTPSVSSISSLSYPVTIPYPAMDPPAYSELPPPPVPIEHESDTETETETETERAESSALSSSRLNSLGRGGGLRSRIFGSREKLSSITTTPGLRGAGETETEGEGPPVRLPTTRNRPMRISQALGIPDASGSHIYTHWLTPILFETSRLLSIVPATLGFLYHVAHLLNRWPDFGSSPEIGASRRVCKIDYAVSAIWALLTAYQCLALTSGLLTRWRVYYPPLPTLIRLLALQAICWPLTHITLSIIGHDKRPEAAWAVVGTATCISRSVQLWVTSNLWWDHLASTAGSNGISSGIGNGSGSKLNEGPAKRSKSHKRWRGGKWGGRRWDWGEVGWQCAVPAGTVYFIMAWAQVLEREWGKC